MTTQQQERTRLRKIVKSFPNLSIAVLGDLVADEYVYGEISRVSREAPVFILKDKGRRIAPGGGGNAVMNLASLGVNVLPVGLIGADESGAKLVEALKAKKISTNGLIKVPGMKTPTKTRVFASLPHAAQQQVVRIDREPEPIAAKDPVYKQLAHAAIEYAPAADALLVSDYGYGSATPALIAALRRAGFYVDTPITLDSRYRMTSYSKLAAATPNQSEVEAAAGSRLGSDRAKLTEAGRKLMSKMSLDSLVMTRGPEGMMVFEGDRAPVDIPIFGSNEVTDVTGAGDTVIATFTAALAAGAGAVSAARLANLAGGIVVMKRGAAAVSPAELLSAIDRSHTARRSRA